jgi:hypothetical protein
MAHNPYGQVYRPQLQPQDQSSMRHYAGQTPADLPGRQYQREDIQYRSDHRRNGHNAQRGNGLQNGYMLDSYENTNQGYNDYKGHVNAEAQGPGQGQGRVYQYDERYHNDTNASSRPNVRQQVGSEAPVGDTRRRAQSKREY